TEDSGGIANPGLNRYIQHGSEPPRSKLGQTWFIDHEAHLLQSRVIVNSNSSKNRYSGTIPFPIFFCPSNYLRTLHLELTVNLQLDAPGGPSGKSYSTSQANYSNV